MRSAERHLIRLEFSGCEVEVPHIDLVGAEVDSEHVMAGEIVQDLVRVRPLLAGRIGSRAIADALKIIGHRPDRTVAGDPKNLKIAAGIARREQVPPRRVHAEMRRVLSIRRLRIDECQRPIRRVYRKGADRPVREFGGSGYR
jgi:hypothetical protein